MPTPALPALQCSAVPENSSFARALKPLLAGSLALLLVACGGGGGQLGTRDPDDVWTPPPPPPTPESLYRIGTGAGSGFQEGVINSSTNTLLRAGETALLRVNVVQDNGEPLTAGTEVQFTSPCIATGLSTITAPQEVTPGLFGVSYTNGNCAGTDTVVARLPNNKTATVTLTVSAAQALTVSHVSTSEDRLVLGGIGGIETSEVAFKVAGPQGVPITSSAVNFSISSSAGEATVLPGWETGTTDLEGNVRTIIKSGTVAGPITVVATHAATAIQGHSPDIIISTGVAVSDRFIISYNPWNPPTATDPEGIVVDIDVSATDMFGNPPIDGTRVSFVAPYFGLVDDFCELQDGVCQVKWRSRGAQPPSSYTAAVLVYMDGAESFVDLNGNSVFDSGDGGQYSDLPEPFADRDGNGQYDLGEFFLDVNKNGVWDPGNGLWDGPCLTALNPVAFCPARKTIAIFDQVTIVMPTNTAKVLSQGTFPAPGSSITIRDGTSRVLSDLVISDVNGNPLPIDTSLEFVVEGTGVAPQGLIAAKIGNSLSAYDEKLGVTLAAAAIPPPTPANPTLCPSNPDAEAPFPEDCFPVLPTNVRLLLTIKFPTGSAATFNWPINVINF